MSDTLQLDKPKHGQPCNGCGLCCVREQCAVSVAIFGEMSLCPAIEQDGPRLTCGLINRPSVYTGSVEPMSSILSETFSLLLGSGGGCDALGFEEVEDPGAGQRMIDHAFERINAASPEARRLVKMMIDGTKKEN